MAFDIHSLAIDTLSADELNALPFGAIKLDGEGRIVSVNRVEQAISGAPLAQLLGRNFFTDVSPGSDRPDVRRKLKRVQAEGERQTLATMPLDYRPTRPKWPVTIRRGREPGSCWLLIDPIDGQDNRMPVAIQPHGAFLAIDRQTGRVKAASANLAQILDIPGGQDMLNRPLAEMLAPEVAEGILTLSDEISTDPLSSDGLQFDPGPARPRMAAQIRRHGTIVSLEMEPATAGFAGGVIANARNWVLRENAKLQMLGPVDSLLKETAATIRRFTEMERVLLYRFDGDMMGILVSDDHAPQAEGAAEGQHLPALPSPLELARSAHDAQIWHIADIDAEPSPILMAPDAEGNGLPRLHPTLLQAPDRQQVARLREQGAQASFSIPILRHDGLWGLVLGLSRTARVVPFERLDAVAVLAGALSDRLEASVNSLLAEDQAKRQSVFNRILKQIASEDTVLRGLTSGPDSVLDLFADTSGAVLELGGQRVRVGHVPDDVLIDQLISNVARDSGEEVWTSDCLSRDFPDFAGLAPVASGALVLFFGPSRQDVIVWFRPGRLGSYPANPHWPKALMGERDPLAAAMRNAAAHPLNRSEPWTEQAIEMARNLRYAVMEVIATQAERLQRANMALEHSNRVKTDFLSMMSHELRTPLNAILGFAQLIQSQIGRPNANDRICGYAETIEQAGRHLLSLINDILQYARLDAGRGDLALGPCPLRESVEQSVAILLPLAAQKNIEIVLNVPETEITARGDKRAIEQVLINLMANAVKYSGGQRIDVTIRPLASQVEIEVADNGSGFPRFVLSNRFQPFLQEDPQVSRPHEGTGLGLALCKLLVDQMHGTIELDNRPRGGARVTVTLPAWRSKAKQDPRRPQEDQG